MRLVIAECSVDYVGRLTAHLPMAPRLLLVKADGSVSIHADDRAYKPLMWMSPPCTMGEEPGRWTVTNKGGEQLVITVEEVLSDFSHELGSDPGLVKDGVEKHLQALLAEQATCWARATGSCSGSTSPRSGRSTCCAATRAAPTSPSRSSATARSTASSSSPATWSG